jgi:heat shock protein HslJ
MLKRSVSLALVFLAVMLLAACAGLGQTGSNNNQGAGSAADLEGHEWVLTELNGQPVIAGAQATAKFENGRVSGSTSCNSYGGEYSLNGDQLALSELVQTEMACMDPEGVMQQEAAFNQAMAQAASYQAAADRLEIRNAAGDVVLVFTR